MRKAATGPSWSRGPLVSWAREVKLLSWGHPAVDVKSRVRPWACLCDSWQWGVEGGSSCRSSRRYPNVEGEQGSDGRCGCGPVSPLALSLSGRRAQCTECVGQWEEVEPDGKYPSYHLLAWKPWTSVTYCPWSLMFLTWKLAPQALFWRGNALCAHGVRSASPLRDQPRGPRLAQQLQGGHALGRVTAPLWIDGVWCFWASSSSFTYYVWPWKSHFTWSFCSLTTRRVLVGWRTGLPCVARGGICKFNWPCPPPP